MEEFGLGHQFVARGLTTCCGWSWEWNQHFQKKLISMSVEIYTYFYVSYNVCNKRNEKDYI